MKKILIISNTIDYHTDAIIKELNQIKLNSFFRLNTDFFHKNYNIRVDLNNESFFIENKLNKHSIKSNEIHTVWWRRPEDLNFENSTIPKFLESFTDDEYYLLLKGLVSILEKKKVQIISHYLNLIKAKDKFRQQLLAKELGLVLPKQLITNNNSFFMENKWIHKSIVKPIDSTNDMIDKQGNEYVSYTKSISKDLLEKISDNRLKLSIHYFQEKINAKYEVRVTYFNNKCYPFKIKGQYDVDWRQIDPKLVNISHFPEFTLQDKCIEFANIMGLQFGAFDLIFDGNHNYFLECNPNGQFLFCDLQNKVGLANDFAKFLLKNGV